jgi:hypothetical protein
MAIAPEAVWPEVLELHLVAVIQPSNCPEAVGGPLAVACAEPLGPEVLIALELLAQPPELPLTPD